MSIILTLTYRVAVLGIGVDPKPKNDQTILSPVPIHITTSQQ